MKKLLQVHLTDKCNLRCKHCYQEGIDYNRIMSISDFKLLLEQFKELEKATGANGRVMNITGGEPLVVPDIMAYIDAAIASGVEKINFLTNGLLLNSEILYEFKKRKIIEVQVSLEGPEEVNDAIRGSGTYAKILEKIKLANEAVLPLKVSYTLNGNNYKYVAETIDSVAAAGARAIWFDRMIPFKGNDLPAVTTQQFKEAMHAIKFAQQHYAGSGFNVLMKRSLQFLYNGNTDECYRCSGIIKNLTVMPDGTILPCRRMPITLGNFKAKSLVEIYNSAGVQELMYKITSYPEECKSCKFKDGCRGGLKCLTYADYGNLDKKDVNCQLNTKLMRIKTVYLMLGSACNFKCNYCIQAESCIKTEPEIAPDVICYLWKLINTRPAKEKLKLILWGGEPLLYFKTIQKMIAEFGDRVNYAMVTNGSLLTDEIVDYLNEHKVGVALSHDGEHTTKTRNVDVLNDERIKKLFLKLEDKSICAVASAYNYDYEKLYDYFKHTIGDVLVNIEILRVNWQMPEKYYDIDLIDLQKKLHNMAVQAVEDILKGEMTRAVQTFLPYLQRLCNQSNIPLLCGQIYRTMNIDLKGNVYSCHNICTPMGTVQDDYDQLLAKQQEWIEKHTAPACKNCEVYVLCKGGCPNDLVKENGEKYTCGYQKVFLKEVLWIADTVENRAMK